MNESTRRLRKWRELGILRDLDVQLVESLARTGAAGVSPDAATILALASRAMGEGHVCLDLSKVDAKWLAGLRTEAAGGAGTPTLPAGLPTSGDGPAADLFKGLEPLVGDGRGGQPFVLDGQRLYLRRFWCYEQRAAGLLLAMAQAPEVLLREAMQRELEAIPTFNAQQKQALRCGLTRRLTIITGGPGTGKTTTAAQILRLLRGGEQEGLRVRLAAPTGKAAARVDDSVRKALAAAGADSSGVEKACTLERLLGFQKGSPYFRHDRDKPLAADVVLVDEASMLDLAKLAKLLEAVGPETRLVLLGDMNQLAAVQPGSVMAELCSAEGLKHAVVRLTQSYRFGADSPVGRLSAEVNEGRAGTAWDLASGQPAGDPAKRVTVRDLGGFARGRVPKEFEQALRAAYAGFLAACEPAAAFKELAKFRILCAVRRGPLGVERINTVIENVLSTAAAPGARRLDPRGTFYEHRVVMVTRNDYSMNLFNGDVGIVLPDPQRGGEPRVVFQDGADTFRWLACPLLPEHETAFAMTVHKAQGSEFGRVLVLLPDQDSPVLTRELVYTALTRTMTGVDLWCEKECFLAAVGRRTDRFIGLGARVSAPAVCGESGS